MTRIIIFLTTFFVNYSFACSPVNKNDGLLFDDEVRTSNPEKAVIAFTGLIIREKRRLDDILKSDLNFIIPEQKWTIVQQEKILTSSLCGLAQKAGERYLFLSDSEDMKRTGS